MVDKIDDFVGRFGWVFGKLYFYSLVFGKAIDLKSEAQIHIVRLQLRYISYGLEDLGQPYLQRFDTKSHCTFI